MVQDDVGVGLDGVRVCFDDERVVSDAGIALVATLVSRLGIEALAGRLVRLRRDRPGAANPGRKLAFLDHVLQHPQIGDGDYTHFARMHAEITVAHAVLESGSAVSEIDRVLGVCQREHRPVYLVLTTDVAAAKA